MSGWAEQCLLPTTSVSCHGFEWRPANIDCFLRELDRLCQDVAERLLFRGHRRSDWLLDSTAARSLKMKFRVDQTSHHSVWLIHPHEDANMHRFEAELQYSLTMEWLRKTERIVLNPELIRICERGNGDPLLTYHINRQQNPNDVRYPDIAPLGTNLLDFTRNRLIGLFFANRNRERGSEGALFVVRPTATGKSLVRGSNSLEAIHQNLQRPWRRFPNRPFYGPPQWIKPYGNLRNVHDPKPHRQEAEYWVQRDLSRDFEIHWQQLWRQTGHRPYIKLVLPIDSASWLDQYLADNSIHGSYLFPSTIFDGHVVR
jgi:hypothetical protein